MWSWFDPSPATDAFYSAVASTASALIGFLGGFFVMRLQTFAEEWRRLEFELESVVREDHDVSEALVKVERGTPTDSAEVARLLEARQSVHARYAPLIVQRARARMPPEFWVQFALLLLLTSVGVWLPLVSMSGPTLGAKVAVVGSVAGLVLILWLAMIIIAGRALKRLRAAG